MQETIFTNVFVCVFRMTVLRSFLRNQLSLGTSCTVLNAMKKWKQQLWVISLKLSFKITDCITSLWKGVTGFSKHIDGSNVTVSLFRDCNNNDWEWVLFHQACKMVHHPEILTLLLKRFEFDYHRMTYVKINCSVDVPHKLQTEVTTKLSLFDRLFITDCIMEVSLGKC